MGKLARLIVQPQDVLYDLLGMFQPKVGDYYPTGFTGFGSGVWADVGANILLASYFPVSRKFKADRIGILIAGAGGAAARVRVGVYDDDDFYPNNLLVDSGELDASSTGFKFASIDLTLDVGRYWVASIANDSTIDIRGERHMFMHRLTATDLYCARYRFPYTFGALPSSFPTGAAMTGSYVLHVLLRVAEVY